MTVYTQYGTPYRAPGTSRTRKKSNVDKKTKAGKKALAGLQEKYAEEVEMRLAWNRKLAMMPDSQVKAYGLKPKDADVTFDQWRRGY